MICSAAILDSDIDVLQSLQVEQFLTKPYHPLDLLAGIDAAMRRLGQASPRACICTSLARAHTRCRLDPADRFRPARDPNPGQVTGSGLECLPVGVVLSGPSGWREWRRRVNMPRSVLRAKDGFMAGKPLNRLDLRRQREAAEPLDPMEDEADEAVEEVEEEEVAEKKPKKKPKAPPKSKAKSARSSKPAARMRIVWVVLNDAFKPVGTFEYTQKEAADARAAELTAKGKGTHFVQRTKEADGRRRPRPRRLDPSSGHARSQSLEKSRGSSRGGGSRRGPGRRRGRNRGRRGRSRSPGGSRRRRRMNPPRRPPSTQRDT